MAEQQSQHRRTLEHAVVTGNVQAEKRGQWLAFVLGVIAIVGGIGLIAAGKDAYGITAIVGALAALSGVFVWGRLRKEKERERKRQDAANER